MLNNLTIKKIASKLQAKFDGKHKLEEYEFILPKTNKNLLVAFRDGKMSFEQFNARTWESVSGIKYAVLDDLKEQCPEWLMQAIEKNTENIKFLYENRDVDQPLQKWEVNQRCFKSIRYHHQKKHQPGLRTKNIKER